MTEKTQESATGKEVELKKDYTVYLYPSTSMLIDSHIGIADKRSRSDFLETAIRFYCGVLDTENNKAFLSDEIIKSVRAIMDEFAGRIFSHLRSEDISISMINELLATALSDMTDSQIKQTRKAATQYVDEHFKTHSFESALKVEKTRRNP